MGKLTAVVRRSLTKPGGYADVLAYPPSVGFFAFKRMGGAGKSASDR